MNAACGLGLALVLLWLCRPAEPWYKPAAKPRHYSVGRASGLLSSLHRSSHTCRFDTDGTAEPGPGVLPPGSARLPSRLHAAVLCVMDVTPEVRSSRVLPGAPGALRCRVDVTMALDPAECADA